MIESSETSAAATELAPADAQDLRHQLLLSEGLAPPPGGGWTIIPRLSVQEVFNDNIFQVSSPRRPDLTTYISPGISVAGETSHLRITATYDPALEINAINGTQNSLTQQFNTIGLLTVIPERLYVDLRAVAGVQATNGLLGGSGGLGGTAPASASTGGFGSANGSGLGLAKNNRTQTLSFGVAPYLVGRLGSYGDYRFGASVDVSKFANARGFFVLPFGGGNSGQTLVTTQQIGHFSSGDYFTALQDQLDVSFSQAQTTTDAPAAASGSAQTGIVLLNGNTGSSRQTVSNQLTYHYNQTFAVFGSLGWEIIRYSGGNALDINGPTWSVGTTVTPNPDSFLTVSYGRQEGATAFNLRARYAATARTTVSASYGSTVGTQLQNLQRQLDVAGPSGTGGLVNQQTGGTAFNGNLLNVQQGVYRFNNMTLNSTTLLERDTIALAVGYTKQTGVGRGAFSGATTEVAYGTGQWIHSLSPVMTVSGAASYTRQQFSDGSGIVQSVALSAVLQYALSETLTASARYLFNDQFASRPGLSLYQDLLIIGITKQF